MILLTIKQLDDGNYLVSFPGHIKSCLTLAEAKEYAGFYINC